MRWMHYWRSAAKRLGALLLMGLLAGGALACASTEAVMSATPTPTSLPGSAGRIGLSAQMTVQRASHTATRLQDGKALIVGGFKPMGSSSPALNSMTQRRARSPRRGTPQCRTRATPLACCRTARCS